MEKSKRMGRPPFTFTDADRQKVARMHAMGITQKDIALVFNTNPKTLRRHFRNELDVSAVEANFKVTQTLFEMATSGVNVAASIFWAKTRCGFRNSTPPPSPVNSNPPKLVIVNNDGAPRAD